MFKETFPSRIKNAREEAGFTQREAAKELKLAQSTLAKYETGSRLPDLEKLGNMALLYDETTDWLLGIGTKKNQEAKTRKYLLEQEKKIIRETKEEAKRQKSQVRGIAAK